MTVPHFVLLSIPMILISIGIGDSFAQDAGENALVAQERYALSAASQSGRRLAWRVDRTDGRVSLCMRPEREMMVCSDWSKPARGDSGPYAINAEYSKIIDFAWVWRIDTQSGEIAMCSIQIIGSDISENVPVCQTPHGPE